MIKSIKPVADALGTALSETAAQKGRRNIPRYLYHVTSKNNYEAMLKDGFIKSAPDIGSNLNGVFMFDLKNFTKRWCNMGFELGINSGENLLTLAKALFLKGSQGSSDIVVLRVPTKDMPLEKLKCRMQGGVNAFKVPLEHAMNGDFAINQKHYTRKRMPIEYIFDGDIPVGKVQKAGEANTGVNLDDLMKNPVAMSDMYKKMNHKEILAKLFENQPEEKCVQFANNSSIKFRELFNF